VLARAGAAVCSDCVGALVVDLVINERRQRLEIQLLIARHYVDCVFLLDRVKIGQTGEAIHRWRVAPSPALQVLRRCIHSRARLLVVQQA